MFAIVSAALLGGPLTTVLLWKHGAVVALGCAPLGGSAAGLAVALSIGAFRLLAESPSAQAAPRHAGRRLHVT